LDKKEALKIVQKDPTYGIKDLSDKFKKDKEIVLEAVKHDPYGVALEHADKKLRADKEVVLAALKNDGSALKYADESLKKDKEIVLIESR